MGWLLRWPSEIRAGEWLSGLARFPNERIYSLGWQAKYSLRDGIAEAYPWVEQHVQARKRTA
jgi:nucleoside-diphosphate-sugar epimerase